jgi:hypothetical protein
MKFPSFTQNTVSDNLLDTMSKQHSTSFNEYSNEKEEYYKSWKPFLDLIYDIRKIRNRDHSLQIDINDHKKYDLYGSSAISSFTNNWIADVYDILTIENYGFFTNFYSDAYFYTIEKKLFQKPRRFLILQIVFGLDLDTHQTGDKYETKIHSIRGKKELTHIYEQFYILLNEYYESSIKKSIDIIDYNTAVSTINKPVF